MALAVSDLERSLEFYCDGLGFQPGRIYQASGGRVGSLLGISAAGFRGVFLRCGQARLELLEYAQRTEPTAHQRNSSLVGYTHVGLVVPDAREAANALVAHGGTTIAELSHSFGDDEPSRIIFVTDPDGNRIELISHPHDAEASAHAHFLGCEEMAWVARDRHTTLGQS